MGAEFCVSHGEVGVGEVGLKISTSLLLNIRDSGLLRLQLSILESQRHGFARAKC